MQEILLWTSELDFLAYLCHKRLTWIHLLVSQVVGFQKKKQIFCHILQESEVKK